MINIDIMELYKLYVADPKLTHEVLQNIFLHGLLDIKTGLVQAKDDINKLEKRPANIRNKLNQIPQIRDELTALTMLFDATITLGSFFRRTPIFANYSGEDIRVRLGAVQSEAECINSKFFERLEQDIPDKMLITETDDLRLKNFDPAKELAIDLITRVIDEVEKIEKLYAKW